MENAFLILIILFLPNIVIKCEYYTALSDMEHLLGMEVILTNHLNKYINDERDKLQRLEKFLENIKSYHHNKYDNSEEFLSNPLNALLLLKRFRSDWPNVHNEIQQQSDYRNEFVSLFKMYQDLSYLPDENDFIGGVTALMRLKDTYDLHISSLVDGNFNGVQYDIKLSASDCLEIGKVFYTQDDFLNSVKWFQQAFARADQANPKTTIDVLDYLSFSLYKTDDLSGAIESTKSLLRLDKNHTRGINNLRIYLTLSEEKEIEQKNVTSDDDYSIRNDDHKKPEETMSNVKDNLEDFKMYKKLCRRELTMPPNIQKALKCRYEHRNLPYLRIGPFKVEEAYRKPNILIYHDVLYDNEINKIKELSKPNFRRATVQNAITGELEVADYRISKSAWLRNEHDIVVERICDRIHLMTGLNLDTAEELQIVNYGIGGHYEPHFDFARKDEKRSFESLGTGNRIATVLFYMSDVQQGGATVFPYIKTALWPTKGSAAFWYNLYPSGQGDYLTRHAACPVLVGSKWVANKWIHFVGQELIRPCNKTLDELEIKGYVI